VSREPRTAELGNARRHPGVGKGGLELVIESLDSRGGVPTGTAMPYHAGSVHHLLGGEIAGGADPL
jgi:hypothetical protein